MHSRSSRPTTRAPTATTADTRLDWPYADRVWRELLFIRPLQALIVFDRVRTSDSLRPYYHGSAWYQMGPNLAAEDVVRSFLMHFEHLPTVQGNRVTVPAGTQTAELITMLPRSPAFRVVNEDVPGHGEAGQYRVELDDSGRADGYFLNVSTGYDAGEPVLQANPCRAGFDLDAEPRPSDARVRERGARQGHGIAWREHLHRWRAARGVQHLRAGHARGRRRALVVRRPAPRPPVRRRLRMVNPCREPRRREQARGWSSDMALLRMKRRLSRHTLLPADPCMPCASLDSPT